MNLFEKQQRNAFSRMKSQRTCPPADTLAKGGEQIALHLVFCERCRKLAKLAKKIDFVCPQQNENTNVKTVFKGAICQIVRNPDIDIFNDGKWLSPPMVAVCQEVSRNDENQSVLVAILHDAPELAAEGDIILSGENSGWFLESWNTFHIDLRWLDYLDVQLSSSEIHEFEAMQGNSAPKESYNLIINEFRKQELETTGFYSRKYCLEKSFIFHSFIETEMIKVLDNDDIAMAASTDHKSPLDDFPELGTINGRIIIINSDEKIAVRHEKFVYINGRLSASLEWKYESNIKIVLLPQVENKDIWSNADFLIKDGVLMIYSDFDESIALKGLLPVAIIKII